MKKMIVVFSLLISIVTLVAAFQIWQNLQNIQKNISILSEEIRKAEKELKYLRVLPVSPVGLIKDGYDLLDHQVHVMSRYYSFRTSLNIKNIGKEGLVADALEPSAWGGIKELYLDVNFYDLKGVDQFLMVISFLEELEVRNSLRIVKIVQKSNNLQAELRLYGR